MNIIFDNTATGEGGGLWCEFDGAPYKYNVIYGNHADGAGGGGRIQTNYQEDLTTHFIDNTVYGNTSSFKGGGFYFPCNTDQPKKTINSQNNIFWGNYAPSDPQLLFTGNYKATITYCDIEGGWVGDGDDHDNIDADPYFCGAANGDFTISDLSPCVDAGAGAGPNEGDDHIGALDVGCGLLILSTDPASNAIGVEASPEIHVDFTGPMGVGSFNDNTFFVYGSLTGRHTGSFVIDGNTATFTPAQDFTAGEIVSVMLTTGIESSSGLPLESGYTWSFTISTHAASGVLTYLTAYDIGYESNDVVGADLDGDGDINLASSNVAGADNVSVLLNDESGSFSVSAAYPVGELCAGIAAGDVDNDGNIDLLTANVNSMDFSVLLNNGDGTFAAHTDYNDGPSYNIALADFNGDGYLDVVTANGMSDHMSVTLNAGDGTFLTRTAYPVGQAPYFVSVADIDNDGDIDFACADFEDNAVHVLVNDGDGLFALDGTYPVGNNPRDLTSGDFNGDGNIDLAVSNRGDDDISILMNNGDGTFAPQVTFIAGAAPESIASVDGDGNLDILIANYDDGTVTVHLNDGLGMFSLDGAYDVAGNFVYALTVADFNGDERPDVATSNSGPEHVSFLFNPQYCTDSDGDGFGDPGYPEDECPIDNCPTVWNPDQEDSDDPPDGVGDACTYSQSTPDGSAVPVDFEEAGITMMFDNVDPPGGTTEIEITGTDPGIDPGNFEIQGMGFPVYYNIETDATGWTLIQICIEYDDTNLSGDEEDLRLLHFGTSPPTDITSWPDYPDVDNNIICGVTSSLSPFALGIPTYVCGDADASGGVDIDDVVYLIAYIFSGGPEPAPYESGDADCSSAVDIDDVVWLIAYIFSGGNAPCDTDGDEVPDC